MTNAEWLIKLIANGETDELVDKGLALGCNTCTLKGKKYCEPAGFNCPIGFRQWLEAEHDADKSRAITLDKCGRRTSWMSEDAYIVYLPTTEVVETFKNYWGKTALYISGPGTYILTECDNEPLFSPTTAERDYHTAKIREIDKLLGILWDKSGKGDK